MRTKSAAAVASDFDDIGDLSALSYADTMEYRMIHPITQKETTWVWTLAGPGHPATLELSEAVTRRQREEDSKYQVKAIAATKANKPVPERPALSQAEARAQNAENMAARVLHFTPVRLGGETIEFSKEAVVSLLTDISKDWIFMQILAALGNRDGFLPNSAPTS